MKKFIYIFALSLLAVSCVYPYDSMPEKSVDNIVVEGDILLGEKSYFQISKVQPLGAPYSSRQTIPARVFVEGDNGYSKEAVEEFVNNEFRSVADLTDIKNEPGQASASYRLRVVLDNTIINGVNPGGGKEYVSEWIKPEGDMVLDNLSFSVDKAKDELAIRMSLHSGGLSQHFRYSYEEDWEYTSYLRATEYYIMPTEMNPYGQTASFNASENIYYCWKHSESRGINLATTEKMSESRLVDYPFKTFHHNDTKISLMYRIDLTVYPVSAGSYKYYENLKSISSSSGDLFSPIPSAMRGNLSSVTDPEELVYGYIAVVFPKKARLYISDEETDNFYHRDKIPEYQQEAVSPDQYFGKYLSGWRPYQKLLMEGDMWVSPAECIDCRLLGGTKNKPADWPTSHE